MSLFGNIGSAWDIDAGVRARLAESLSYIVGQAGSYLDVDRGRLDGAVERIRIAKQDPGVFARYFALISAVDANRFAEADALLNEIIERAAKPVSFAIVPFSEEELGADYQRFPQLLFAEFSTTSSMASPSPGQSAASTQMFREAIALVAQADPDIHDEIQALLTRIYLAVPSNDPSAKPFGGVTSLMVWGASFANIELYGTRWDAVQFLVHEITHALLFGLSYDEPLVLNSAADSFKSPLRTDPRPMDGIFHATLVCGRLAAFNRGWVDNGITDAADRERSKAAAAKNACLFHDGLATIYQHAILSDLGRRLIDRSCAGLSELAPG
jgi:hypothetical protein